MLIEVSSELIRSHAFGSGGEYPRIYRASNLSDIKIGQAELTFHLIRQNRLQQIPVHEHNTQPLTCPKRSDAFTTYFIDTLKHNPFFDPFDPDRLYGVDSVPGYPISLSDQNNDTVTVYPIKESYLYFPYWSCFNSGENGMAYFNLEGWEKSRKEFWEYPVVILTQLQRPAHDLENTAKTSYMCWLIHVFNHESQEGNGAIKPAEMIDNLKPLYHPRSPYKVYDVCAKNAPARLKIIPIRGSGEDVSRG